DSGTDTSQVTIKPDFEWIGGRRTAAFVRRTLVRSAHRVRFAFIGLAVHDPDAATIRFPTWYAGAEVLVGVCDSFVVLLFELVLVSVRIGIAPAPKFLDESFAFVVSSQFFECLTFFVSDDVGDVFVEPVFVSLFEFRLYIAWLVAGILLILRK